MEGAFCCLLLQIWLLQTLIYLIQVNDCEKKHNNRILMNNILKDYNKNGFVKIENVFDKLFINNIIGN